MPWIRVTLAQENIPNPNGGGITEPGVCLRSSSESVSYLEENRPGRHRGRSAVQASAQGFAITPRGGQHPQRIPPRGIILFPPKSRPGEFGVSTRPKITLQLFFFCGFLFNFFPPRREKMHFFEPRSAVYSGHFIDNFF